LQQPSEQPALLPDNPKSGPTEQQQSNEQVSYGLDETGIQILRATRSWIQYGTVGFAVICILIGAVEGLFGR
jgi:hypothetical protein